jgi:hypothetical protein
MQPHPHLRGLNVADYSTTLRLCILLLEQVEEFRVRDRASFSESASDQVRDLFFILLKYSSRADLSQRQQVLEGADAVNKLITKFLKAGTNMSRCERFNANPFVSAETYDQHRTDYAGAGSWKSLFVTAQNHPVLEEWVFPLMARRYKKKIFKLFIEIDSEQLG